MRLLALVVLGSLGLLVHGSVARSKKSASSRDKLAYHKVPQVAVPSTIDVAAVSYNVAGNDKAKNIAHEMAIITQEVMKTNPLLVSFGFQESRLGSKEYDKLFLRILNGRYTRIEDEEQCDPPFGNGCNAIFLYGDSQRLPKKREVGIKKLKLTNLLSGESNRETTMSVKTKSFGGFREKCTLVIRVKFNQRPICFMSSHLHTHSGTDGKDARVNGMRKHIQEIEDSRFCDYIVWGGDFNVRTGPWVKKERNALFDDMRPIEAYYKSLNIPAHGLMRLSDDLPAFNFGDNEAAQIIVENYLVTGQKVPPTFQPIPMDRCPSAENLALLDKTLKGHAIFEAGSQDKRYVCLKTGRGGNCASGGDATQTHACFTATRPISQTDFWVLRHTKLSPITVVDHGMYHGPMNSDHFPIFVTGTLTNVVDIYGGDRSKYLKKLGSKGTSTEAPDDV
jgi:hypothetical protein